MTILPWRLYCFLWLAGVIPALCSAPTDTPRSLGDLSGPWQLMVDDYLEDDKQNLVRRYHPFQKHPANPVLKPDRPWEGQVAYLLGTALPAEDGQGYRLWYHTAESYRNLYAASPDAIHWTKPELGIVKYQGSGANNIFIDRMRESHIPMVIHTPWDPDPQKRYKLVYYDYGRTDPLHSVSGYYGAWSADGIHWSATREEPLLADPGDVGNFVWDPHQKRYLGYAKIFVARGGFRRRAIGMTWTRDFLHWPPTQLVLVPDTMDDRWITKDRQHTDFYGLSAFAYESMYLGFLWVFRINDGHNDGTIHIELVSSRDGIRWQRQEGERLPILQLGAPGQWDDGMVHTASHPLLEGDTLKLLYGGSDQTHESPVAGGWGNCAIGLATLRKDGFASLDAGEVQGSLTTRSLRGLSGTLRVNADARRGWIKVEVLDSQGNVIPGYGRAQCQPIREDGINQVVSWQGNDQLPRSTVPLRLRFLIQNASLYAFRSSNELQPVDSRPPLDVYLDFEAEQGTSALDKSAADGRQPVRFHNAVKIIQDEARAFSGTGAAAFTGKGKTHDALQILGTRYLGTRFTLSVRVKAARKQRMRLFSSYRGTGEPTAGELIFDFNPRGGDLRFIYNGQRVVSRSSLIRTDRYHHLEAAYDHGRVRLYVDAKLVGEGILLPGTSHLFHDRSVLRHFGSPAEVPTLGVVLGEDLRVGQDLEGRFVTHQHEDQSSPDGQLIGLIDDVRVTSRAQD